MISNGWESFLRFSFKVFQFIISACLIFSLYNIGPQWILMIAALAIPIYGIYLLMRSPKHALHHPLPYVRYQAILRYKRWMKVDYAICASMCCVCLGFSLILFFGYLRISNANLSLLHSALASSVLAILYLMNAILAARLIRKDFIDFVNLNQKSFTAKIKGQKVIASSPAFFKFGNRVMPTYRKGEKNFSADRHLPENYDDARRRSSAGNSSLSKTHKTSGETKISIQSQSSSIPARAEMPNAGGYFPRPGVWSFSGENFPHHGLGLNRKVGEHYFDNRNQESSTDYNPSSFALYGHNNAVVMPPFASDLSQQQSADFNPTALVVDIIMDGIKSGNFLHFDRNDSVQQQALKQPFQYSQQNKFPQDTQQQQSQQFQHKQQKQDLQQQLECQKQFQQLQQQFQHKQQKQDFQQQLECQQEQFQQQFQPSQQQHRLYQQQQGKKGVPPLILSPSGFAYRANTEPYNRRAVSPTGDKDANDIKRMRNTTPAFFTQQQSLISTKALGFSPTSTSTIDEHYAAPLHASMSLIRNGRNSTSSLFANPPSASHSFPQSSATKMADFCGIFSAPTLADNTTIKNERENRPQLFSSFQPTSSLSERRDASIHRAVRARAIPAMHDKKLASDVEVAGALALSSDSRHSESLDHSAISDGSANGEHVSSSLSTVRMDALSSPFALSINYQHSSPVPADGVAPQSKFSPADIIHSGKKEQQQRDKSAEMADEVEDAIPTAIAQAIDSSRETQLREKRFSGKISSIRTSVLTSHSKSLRH